MLAIAVRLPGCSRVWALPVLAALYVPPPKEQIKTPKPAKGASSKAKAKNKRGKKSRGNKQRLTPQLRKRDKSGRLPPRHKTPALLARQMMATLMHWFPDRQFILLGDWGFASHDLALFCHRHRRRLTLVARTRSDMNLHALPAARRPGRPGAPARKGRKLPTPAQAVAAAISPRRHARPLVRQRRPRPATAGRVRRMVPGPRQRPGRAGPGPLGLRPGPCHQPGGLLLRDRPVLGAQRIVETFAGRWPIEVTFEEVRAHLGFEATRHWCKSSVLRVAPCLLGLFSVVSLIYAELAQQGKVKVRTTPCYRKTDPTFADALAMARRLMWEEVILQHAPFGRHVTQLPPPIREMLLEHVTAAA